MYSHVNCMSLVCQSYVLLRHSYFTRIMYSYVIRMSLVCTRMPPVCNPISLVCTRISPACHSYVLVCHPYVIRLCFYHEPLFSNTFLTLRRIKHFMNICQYNSIPLLIQFATQYLFYSVANWKPVYFSKV